MLRPFAWIVTCLIAASVLASAVSAATFATVDVEQLEQKSKVFQSINDNVAALARRLSTELDSRSKFKYLAPEEAERAAALYAKMLRKENLSTQERKDLDGYTTKDAALGEEWIPLTREQDPNEQQRLRLAELTRWQRANRDALTALQGSIETRFVDERRKLGDLLQKHMDESIDKASSEVGASICVTAVVTIYQPTLDGSTLKPTPVRIVHWGGQDVSARVIALLDEVDLSKEIKTTSRPASEHVVTVRMRPDTLVPSDEAGAKDGEPHMRLLGTGFASLPLLLATLATAQPAQAQGVAYIDVYMVQRGARPYQDLAQELVKLRSERSDEYIVANNILFLGEQDAQRAIELHLKQMRTQALADAEQTELRALVDKERNNQNEYFVLAQKPEGELAGNEVERLGELNKLRAARQNAIQELASKNMKDVEDREAQGLQRLQDSLRAAIERASQEAGANICLQKWIIVFEPNQEGGFEPAPVNVIHWGGTDVTAKVIEILNGGAAPAPAQ